MAGKPISSSATSGTNSSAACIALAPSRAIRDTSSNSSTNRANQPIGLTVPLARHPCDFAWIGLRSRWSAADGPPEVVFVAIDLHDSQRHPRPIWVAAA